MSFNVPTSAFPYCAHTFSHTIYVYLTLFGSNTRCHANEAHLKCTDTLRKEKARDKETKWERLKAFRGHPLEQTAPTVSLHRKSASTQKLQKPSGLGGYATSRDNGGSFTLSSPARAICSGETEWERGPQYLQEPPTPKTHEYVVLKNSVLWESWYENMNEDEATWIDEAT